MAGIPGGGRPVGDTSTSLTVRTIMTLADTSTLRRMCWVFPDRESSRSTAFWPPFFGDIYPEVAAELGMTWERVAPAAITVDGSVRGKPQVYVDSDLVTP